MFERQGLDGVRPHQGSVGGHDQQMPFQALQQSARLCYGVAGAVGLRLGNVLHIIPQFLLNGAPVGRRHHDYAALDAQLGHQIQRIPHHGLAADAVEHLGQPRFHSCAIAGGEHYPRPSVHKYDSSW